MTVRIIRLAQEEYNDAYDYYEATQPDPGSRFADAIHHALLRIRKYPCAGQIEYNEIRRCLVRGFPYKILYSLQDNVVVVLAFAHTHRMPEYWIDRLQ